MDQQAPTDNAAATEELLAQARTIHDHVQLLRNHVLKGREDGRFIPSDSREPTWTQLRAMMVLATVGPCTLKEFAKEMDVAPASASEMVDRLHESGWVSRRQDTSDRRRIVVELTKEARDCSDSHERLVLGQLLKLIERMESEQVNNWLGVIGHINKLITEEGGR